MKKFMAPERHGNGVNINTLNKVTISGPTVDWMRAEVGDWLARHPGEKRRAIRGLMGRPEYRRMAHMFYGER